jgi:hypothetical protein
VQPNHYKQAWERLEASRAIPARYRGHTLMSFDAFRAKVESGDRQFSEYVCESLYAGEALILRKTFSAQFMRDLREKTVAWTRSRPESFHRMVEGTPDFHRVIDLETGKKYSINGCKHSAYFYRWNDDPLGIWPHITDRWRVAKTVMGLEPNEYEVFTPKDGVVDRIQVVRYPPSIGYLEPHVDAWQHQRCFFSVYMSKRGEDYQGGGFYFVNASGKAQFLEDQIEVGDVCLGHANLLHGVAPCDRDKTPDWNATDGRWFLSLYSNASDEVAHRHTAAPVKVAVEGVLP